MLGQVVGQGGESVGCGFESCSKENDTLGSDQVWGQGSFRVLENFAQSTNEVVFDNVFLFSFFKNLLSHLEQFSLFRRVDGDVFVQVREMA